MKSIITSCVLLLSSAWAQAEVHSCTPTYLEKHRSGIESLLSKWTAADADFAYELSYFLKTSEVTEREWPHISFRFSCWNDRYLDVFVEDETVFCEYSVTEDLPESSRVSSSCETK